ncbi:hypothetical protein [Methanorbis rubei]
MAEITILNIFDAILQIIPYSIACLYYTLLSIPEIIFGIFDNILWHPVSLIWNSVIDFMSFMQTFFELSFSWGAGLIIIPCFLVCLTVLTVRLVIGVWFAIKKLIPVIG